MTGVYERCTPTRFVEQLRGAGDRAGISVRLRRAAGSGPVNVRFVAEPPACDPGVDTLTAVLLGETGVRSSASSESMRYCGVCTPTL